MEWDGEEGRLGIAKAACAMIPSCYVSWIDEGMRCALLLAQ